VPSFIGTAAGVLATIFFVFAVGCASVNRLREAQDAFNAASAAENAQRFAAPSDAISSLGSVRSGYASALLSLSRIDSEDAKQLQRDGLWSTTLTLKALCHWRLGQYEPALKAAAEAKALGVDRILPRDKAILEALPGLIKTDQAYELILSEAPGAHPQLMGEVAELLVGPNGSVADIDRARASADRNHPVQVYLLQTQLAAYRNCVVAQDRLNSRALVAEGDPAQLAGLSQLKELKRVLAAEDSENAQQLVNYWEDICGLTLDP
jgi:hypothetical protein